MAKSFSDQLMKQVRAAVKPKLEAIADEHTNNLNELSERMKGQPLDDIKVELTAIYDQLGEQNKLEEPGLTKYAQQIHDGGRFNGVVEMNL